MTFILKELYDAFISAGCDEAMAIKASTLNAKYEDVYGAFISLGVNEALAIAAAKAVVKQ